MAGYSQYEKGNTASQYKNTPYLHPNGARRISNASIPRPTSGASVQSSSLIGNNRVADTDAGNNRAKSHSLSSNVNTLSSSKGSVSAENRDKQRFVRTLPPWVRSIDEDNLPIEALSVRAPNSIRPATHNHTPMPKPNTVPGRHFDHERERTPVTVASPSGELASKWRAFAKASSYGRPSGERGRLMDEDWLKDNLPDLEAPWEPEEKEDDDDGGPGFWLFNHNKRKKHVKRAHKTLMKNPFVPLIIRVTVIVFSSLALGLSGSIYVRAGNAENCDKGSSTYMAIIVDVVAIVYSVYIAIDEYTSKPLGLRSHRAKVRLVFLDIFFIVFDSANLSVAFEALTDPVWACRQNGDEQGICAFNKALCDRQKALTATLLMALLAWLATFAISMLRVIEKVAAGR